MPDKILTVVGARPQFVKAAMVSFALRRNGGPEEVLVHTGQHYDANMSHIFFDEMGMPQPDTNLEVGSGGHAYQTGRTMERLEAECLRQRPDLVLIYGDTNATLAGALVAAKLCIPLAHVEAGLRSFDRTMPEEINRIVADRLSALLFCPTQTAVDNLHEEGVRMGTHRVGDVMFDAAIHFGEVAAERSRILADLQLDEQAYALVTIHRDFNTDNEAHMRGIVEGLLASGNTIVFPAHPRVRKQLEAFGLADSLAACDRVRLIEPVGYLDMIRLEMSAAAIVTDSGGVQKEALFHRVPCVTVRPSTEWVETVEAGWNRLVEAERDAIASALAAAAPPDTPPPACFGDGHAADLIAKILDAVP